jgi:YHS domain-containing protein
MKTKSLLQLLTLTLGLAINVPAIPAEATKPAPAQPAAEKKPSTEKKPAEKGPPKPYPLDVCIVTDNDLDSMGDETVMVYEGQTIKFCCKPCEEKFLKNPARYLKKLAPEAK